MRTREPDRVFVLVHSPLVGPKTWSRVADELGRRGRPAVVPSLLGIADALTGEVAALVFVDSFLPRASGSVRLAPPGFADQPPALATGGVLPPWSSWFGDDAMRELVPDDALRTALEEEMPRLPLSYFDASVPLPEGWDALPCAYLLLSGERRPEATTARALRPEQR